MPEREPLDYFVRESRRARRVRLVMSVHGALEVVVPVGYDRRGIQGIVEEKADWIRRASAEMERRRGLADHAVSTALPESVAFRALSEEWRVEYRDSGCDSSVVRTSEVVGDDGLLLRVVGGVSDEEACRRALARWLTRKAREHFVPVLEITARELGFRVGEVSIRRQRTRWGSCSRKGDISLNAKLLFLEAELAEYVMLHELCHTLEPNHSSRFWTLLGDLDPEYERKRRALRYAGGMIPGWLDRSGHPRYHR